MISLFNKIDYRQNIKISSIGIEETDKNLFAESKVTYKTFN